MYLTIMHPEVLHHLEVFAGGIWPVRIGEDYCLIIKAAKEIILTAKVNKGFDFYLAPIQIHSESSIAVMTAFYDNDDEPLVITTPLLRDDASTDAFLELLKNDNFNVFFFDEHNRELLGYKASGNLREMHRNLTATTFLGIDAARQILEDAGHWFGRRSNKDDQEAYTINFRDNLFRDDFIVMDIDIEKHSFIGSQGFSSTSLEREEPGSYQELDIVFLLQRVFDCNQIFLNPTKDVDGKEFVDVMVVGNEAIFLIQAKDSPNTERILRNTVKRKRIKSLSQLTEAANQLAGAVSYANKNNTLRFLYNGRVVEVDTSEKQFIGVLIVKELFSDSLLEYSDICYDFVEKSQVPVVFFDYPEFSMMTLHCQTEPKLLDAIHQIFSFAMENDQFPRLRYSGKPKGKWQPFEGTRR